MQLRALVLVAMLSAGLAAQSPPPAPVANLLPDSARVEQFIVSADGQRTYYTTAGSGVRMYDRSRKTASQVVSDMVWDLALSPAGDLLAFSKAGDTRRAQHVWIVPLSKATGLPTGPERRISARAGDIPAISPDGKSVAFARDDSTGVGQSLVVAPVAGGAERVLAAGLPSGLGGIRWTPNGESLYFGVNSPVPFPCAERCLTC